MQHFYHLWRSDVSYNFNYGKAILGHSLERLKKSLIPSVSWSQLYLDTAREAACVINSTLNLTRGPMFKCYSVTKENKTSASCLLVLLGNTNVFIELLYTLNKVKAYCTKSKISVTGQAFFKKEKLVSPAQFFFHNHTHNYTYNTQSLLPYLGFIFIHSSFHQYLKVYFMVTLFLGGGHSKV